MVVAAEKARSGKLLAAVQAHERAERGHQSDGEPENQG